MRNKRLKSIIIIACMVIALIPGCNRITAFAENDNKTEAVDVKCIVLDPNDIVYSHGDIKARLMLSFAKIIGLKNKKKVVIGSTITYDGIKYPVVEIKKKAVSGNKIKEVTIYAKNIAKIDKEAFKGAKKLRKVTIVGISKRSKISKRLERAVNKANKNVKIIYR